MPENSTPIESQSVPANQVPVHEEDIPPPPFPVSRCTKRAFEEHTDPRLLLTILSVQVRWFHAVDSPLTKPNEPKKNPKVPAPPRKPPTLWVPFSIRDSNALEKAYQEMKQAEDGSDSASAEDPSHPPDSLRVPTSGGSNSSAPPSSLPPPSSSASSILVNEDYLFEVNIHKMEIKPVCLCLIFCCFQME